MEKKILAKYSIKNYFIALYMEFVLSRLLFLNSENFSMFVKFEVVINCKHGLQTKLKLFNLFCCMFLQCSCQKKNLFANVSQDKTKIDKIPIVKFFPKIVLLFQLCASEQMKQSIVQIIVRQEITMKNIAWKCATMRALVEWFSQARKIILTTASSKPLVGFKICKQWKLY